MKTPSDDTDPPRDEAGAAPGPDDERSSVDPTSLDRDAGFAEEGAPGAEPPDDDPPDEDWRLPLAIAAGVTVAVGATFLLAFDPTRPGKTAFVILAGSYAVLTAATIGFLKRRRDLSLLRFKGGDITIAGVVAGILYGLAFAVHVGVTARPPREGWIFRVYQLVGGPLTDDRVLFSIALAGIGVMEEIVWRGLVYGILEPALGRAKALVASSLLFGAAHLPTIYLLRDEIAGLNPLLPLAAVGCGAVWCYLRIRTDRLLPSVLSHGLFTWAVVQFPLWHR